MGTKISELNIQSPLDGTEYVECIIAPYSPGTNRRVTTQEIADLANPGGAVDSVNGQTGVVVLDAFDVDADNGAPVASTTGTAIAFAVPQFYASAETPATGNVTLVTTGLVAGMVQVLYHDDSSEPTFPAEFSRLSGFYVTNTLNIIYMHAISATRIEYMIFQEL